MQSDLFAGNRRICVWLMEDTRIKYCYSTWEYKTCQDAVKAAMDRHPGLKFVANFTSNI